MSKPKLLEQLRNIVRVRHYSAETERAYVHWVNGSGLRLMECLRLRVGDIDFSRHSVRIHAGKGGKGRMW